MTRILAYTQPHNAGRLYTDLTTALPELGPTDGLANLLISSDGADAFWLTVPDATDEALIDPVLAAHDPTPDPPPVTAYAHQLDVSAKVRTTSALVLEVFRFPCAERHLYRANLRISGVDTAPGMVSLVQEGRFVWRREAADAILDGITVVSQIPATIPSGWATNCFPSGADIVFTVKGPAGRIVDWLLVGEVGRFAPEGLD